jgi:Clostripain family.
MDTLRRYDDMAVSAAPESMRRVLGDIRDAFPARRYGMIISSHGTGWLPGGYSRNTTPRAAALQEGGRTDGQDDGTDGQGGSAGSSREIYGPEGIWPPTKAIGNQYTASSRIHWMEVGALAGAIPFHLEYLIIDACLSGAVEIAWELRDVSDRLVVSPAEILTAGMGYSNLSWDMLASGTPDLERYCREYYEHYNGQSGSYRSGTIALVESAPLPALADAFAAVLDAHRDALDYNKLSASVQRYYYGTSPLIFFYDLRDFAAQLGASPDELARLDAALGAAVPVHYETPTFFDLSLERCCGLSVYIPDPSRPALNDYYRALGWNRAVGLVQ